jgi:ferritin
MIEEKISDALNYQLNAELYSAYLYLSMEAYFESEDLNGFANWMRVQAQEELTHAMKFYDHIVQRGGRVILSSIDTPPSEWKSPSDAFEAVYEHEKRVTGLINELVNLAIAEGDHASNNFLQWFVAEQVEEEESASGVLQKIKLTGETPGGLFILDSELSQRVFHPPAEPE